MKTINNVSGYCPPQHFIELINETRAGIFLLKIIFIVLPEYIFLAGLKNIYEASVASHSCTEESLAMRQ